MYWIIHGKRCATVLLMLCLTATGIGLWSREEVPEKSRAVFHTMETTVPAPILIIDPGHGGTDGGAVGIGGIIESETNLAIALKLENLAHFFGICTVMTRSSAEIEYPADATTIAKQKQSDQNQRIALINSYPDAILVSIHQNFYPHEKPHGAQVLYGHTAQSELFGCCLHENLLRCIDPSNRRVAAPVDEKIYLMRKVNCTAVLVECGFLSNPEETALLQTEGYQRAIATVILGSYLQFISTSQI